MEISVHPYYLGGESRSLSFPPDRTVTVRSPWDDRFIGAVAQADSSDCNWGIELALRGFEATKRLTAKERSEILQSISESLLEEREVIAKLITDEVAKPITLARLEVDRASATFAIAAEETKRIEGEVIPLDLSSAVKNLGIVKRFPVGVVLCISPFNFPLNLVAHKVAPAIAAGNAFILKPAPQAPLTALRLGEIIAKTAFPKEAWSILPCSNLDAETLVRDPRISMLSFTGSPDVGWGLKTKAGRKKVTLELGGNAGVIVDASADLRVAAEKCCAGAFANSGQVCIKVQRIVVHESIYASFRDQLIECTRKIPFGDPYDPATVSTSVINDAAALRLDQWLQEAIAQGATIASGGKRTGRIFEPTILEHVDRNCSIYCKEAFGPIVTLHSYSTFEEAVSFVNDSRYGLQAGVFTNDFQHAMDAFKNIEAGGVIINDVPTFRADHMPYGGVKESGYGREGVKYAIQEMTEPKLLVIS